MKLRDSQQVALERLCEKGRHFGALWAEPRSGKTAVALLWLEHIRPQVAVIVGPKIAEAVWRTEAAKWLTTDYRFFPLTAGNEYPALHRFSGITLLFVNYEQFATAPYKRLKPYLTSLSKHCGGQGAMLLDESHMIKTPSSISGRNIRPLARHWHYRLLMTGTPVTNPGQVDAVYGQWTFLDPDIRSKWPSAADFRDHFGEWTNVKGFPELIRPRNQYELNKYLQPDVITMVGDSNPVTINKVDYRVPDDVRSAHSELMKTGIVSFRNGTYTHDPKLELCDTNVVAALNPLTRLLRARTLVAGWVTDDEGHIHRVHAAARRRLGVLHRLLGETGKTIVACTHLQEVALVGRSLERHGVGYATITGSVRDRNYVIEQFQRDPDMQVLLVQPRTVSMAVDISVASDLIWYTSDFNYVTFKQASDRIKLSPANPTVWFLSGRGTVDEDVWVTLQEDHDHMHKVIDAMRNRNLKNL